MTGPGIWAVLAAVILLLAGIFAWASVGRLETRTDAKVIVQAHTAEVIPSGTALLETGMPLRVSSQESVIASVETDAYGRVTGISEIELPDGTYDGVVITDSVHPLDFLLESR